MVKKSLINSQQRLQPEFEDEEAIDPFDFWQGANFKLKAKNVAGYRNYDSSEFTAVTPLLDDDDALESLFGRKKTLLKSLLMPISLNHMMT